MHYSIINAKIHTGLKVIDNQSIEVLNGRIVALNETENPAAEVIDLQGYHISAGFIDTHINGGERLYFTEHPTIETIADINDACIKQGTAYTLPCLITSSLENILKGIEATKQYMAQNPNAGVLGMHLEGPFLNMSKRGAHQKQYIRKPTDEELQAIIEAGRDVIKIMTIAPEEFTESQIQMLLDAGINLSVGHSNATYETTHSAYNQGIKLCTHLFNAMSQFGHREPGVVGATFDDESVYAPIILDGFHCDYAAARIAHSIKKDKLFLISDALFVNEKIKHFKWENFDAFLENGQYRNSEGNLAGAAIAMADAVRNAVQQIGISLDEAIEMATIRPAKAIGMSHQIGQIATGFPAKFTIFDEDLYFFKPLILG
jgi:N-acetylglucosamine-6-phosphate deacetylase